MRLNFWTTFAGALLMLFALMNSVVTLATRDYRGALLTALASTVFSLACLAIPFRRGPTTWRIVATLIASSALFVVSDFLSRAPYTFGGG